MTCKCTHLWGVISLICVTLTTQSLGVYDINNGRFELFDYNETLEVNIPSEWICENYTGVINYFEPDLYSGYFWKISQLYPIEGEHFLMLSTGDVSYDSAHARAQQTITVEAGQTLTGACFFGTYDWLNWDDFGRIVLIPFDSNLSELEIVRSCVNDVGNYGSMKEWKRFAYTFEADEAGDYNLVIETWDVGDTRYNSYFAVDGLTLCSNASGGDLNFDCATDFQDFSLLASAWMCDCNNINNYQDPNTNCLFALDLTDDDIMDFNDLAIISQYWLEGIKEPEEPEEPPPEE